MESNSLRSIIYSLVLMFVFSLIAEVLITRYYSIGYLNNSEDYEVAAGEVEKAVVTGHISGSVIKVEMEDGQKCNVQFAGAITPFSGSGFNLAYEYIVKELPIGTEVFLERAFNSLEFKDSKYKIRYVWTKEPCQKPGAKEIRNNLLDAKIVMEGIGYSIPCLDNSYYGNYIVELGQYASKNRIGLWNEK